MEAAVCAAQEARVRAMAAEAQLSLSDLDGLLQPIIDTCTKDAISTGKTWIFSNAKSTGVCEALAEYLRWRIVRPGSSFELRLHLIYLINDVLHH
ncbi:calcium homeostasis endoplasmic reticulum protein-like, partial [Lethenteron reissneri]